MCETASIIELGEALPAGVRRTRYTGIIRHLSILRLKPSFRLKIASRTRQFVAARWHTDCSSFKQRGRHVVCFYVSNSKNVRRSRPNSTARLLKILRIPANLRE
jgi:hypothetical protein